MGTRETPGQASNPKIIAWARVIGKDVQQSYTMDSIPWCGLFVAYCMVQAGIRPVAAPLWALNWSKFGERLKVPAFGCIISMRRDGGGHVGFLVSQDKDNWHVLGGNQSDMVNVTKVPKSREVYFNFPIGFDQHKRPVPHKPFDGKLSNTLKFD